MRPIICFYIKFVVLHAAVCLPQRLFNHDYGLIAYVQFFQKEING